MNDEKHTRLSVAVVITAALLIILMLAVIIYQIVEIVVLTSKKNQLQKEHDKTVTQTDYSGDTLACYTLEQSGETYELVL